MIDQDDMLRWTFYYMHDGDKSNYLIGSKLSGKYITQEDHPLNNKEAFIMISSKSIDFMTGYVPFVWDDKVKIYHTEKMLEVPVVVAGDNFSNLEGNLVVRNALVARNNLKHMME